MWKFEKVIFNECHAQLPTPIYIGNSTIRVYYSTKKEGISNIFFVDIDENTLSQVSPSKAAMLQGDRGMFDSSGVMPSSIFTEFSSSNLERRYEHRVMYYTGWRKKVDVPYGHAIGIADINEDGTLVRRYSGPILDANIHDAHLVNSAFVDKMCGFHIMLYSSGTGWIDDYPCYCIKKAMSFDGEFWITNKSKEITFGLQDEAISRVTRDYEKNIWYFSMKTKNTNYKIYTQNDQGLKESIVVGSNGWDDEMQCYPFIYQRGDIKYMFYNGNGYGATGIGVAKWIEDIV